MLYFILILFVLYVLFSILYSAANSNEENFGKAILKSILRFTGLILFIIVIIFFIFSGALD